LTLYHLSCDYDRVNMYIYLSDKDSPYFDNSPSNFIVKLPINGLDLSGEVGLCEIHLEFINDVECFDLCCDICDTSVVGENVLPILRRIHTTRRTEYIAFDPIYYIPVIKTQSDTLNLYLRPVHSDSSSVALKTLNCTLHIKQ